jgi:hypothetical protein
VRKEEGGQRQCEHDEGAAEHERRPAPERRERGERDERESENGDRTSAGEKLGREPVALRREDIELARVLLEGAVELAQARRVRGGRAYGRQQPERHRRRRKSDGEKGRCARYHFSPRHDRACDHVAEQRQAQEDGVRGMNEREGEGRRSEGRQPRPGAVA